nr:VWA domain-containing protein [Deltaproteobacteria bacterium]
MRRAGEGWPATVARVVAAALVVLAIADARVRWPTRALAVALVVDRSASVSPREAAAMRAAMPRRRIDRDGVRWIDPGAAARRARWRPTSRPRSTPPWRSSRPDRVRRLVLATDGRETRGEAVGAADRARRAGVRVFVLPQGRPPAVDAVALAGVELPRIARAGREVSAGVRLFSSGERRVTIRVLRDGAEVARREVDAPAGQSLHDLSVAFPEEGVHELRVTATAEGDRVSQNNSWRMLVRVVTPPRVLLVHELEGRPLALASVYREAHLAVDEVHPEGVPCDVGGMERYQYVVLDELVLTSLTEPQQRALRVWVEERGGGLLTTTGMHGVGREPELLREIEPIMPPRAVPEPRPIELILVIDRSGSMMGPPIVNARNAGIAAVRALRPDSRVGVVAFSGAADLVVAPVPVTESETVTRAIAGIRAGGGTNLAAALEAAASVLSRDDRYLHHVILMSDGESRGPPAIAAAQTLRAGGRHHHDDHPRPAGQPDARDLPHRPRPLPRHQRVDLAAAALRPRGAVSQPAARSRGAVSPRGERPHGLHGRRRPLGRPADHGLHGVADSPGRPRVAASARRLPGARPLVRGDGSGGLAHDGDQRPLGRRVARGRWVPTHVQPDGLGDVARCRATTTWSFTSRPSLAAPTRGGCRSSRPRRRPTRRRW